MSNGYLDFEVIDDKGKELLSYSGSSKIQTINGKEQMTGTRLFDSVTADVKTLTVIPYFKFHQGGSSVEIDVAGKEVITELPF